MKKLTVLSLFLFVFLLSSCELLEGIEDIDDVNDLIDDIEEYVPLEGIDEALKLATGGEIEGIF
jgi:predicted small secreted protein